MDSRTRVLTALACKQPDRVPFVLAGIDTELQEEIVGHPLEDYRLDLRLEPGLILRPGEEAEYSHINYLIHPATARRLELDAVGIKFPSPLFCEAEYSREGYYIQRGSLSSRAAWQQARFPDVNDPRPYQEAERFIRRHAGEFAIFASLRLGCAPTLLSMGYDLFGYMLYDDRALVEEIVEGFTDWARQLVTNLAGLGLDFVWACDDIAYAKNTLISPQAWREVFQAPLKKVASQMPCPWIYHSDGNLFPLLDDLLTLGMNGLHPLEPGAMDIRRLKDLYGNRLCLVGNIDVGPVLTEGNPELVESTVIERMQILAPGGGYMIADSNSVPYYCKAENVLALSESVRRHRDFYG
jgi:uroporphyrinogen decarboxylase